MSVREKITRYYSGTDGAEVAAKLMDAAELVNKNRKYKVSDFLDPYGLSVAETIIAHFPNLKFTAEGGYFGAERQRGAIVHEDFLGEIEYGLTVVAVTWNDKYHNLAHRDVLGSVLGLGISRDVVGDILMRNDHCKIILTKEIFPFVLQDLTQISNAGVSVAEAELSQIEPKEERCKEIKTTIASLRLDAVAAAGFGVSRSKISNDIEADKVKVNWQPAKSSSQVIKESDIVSMRGRGRIEIEEIRGQTKKGRISIVLKRFI